MQKELKNYAFIDGQNLNLGIQQLGWKVDYTKFRTFLTEKYGVKIAYYFLGYMPENTDLYNRLQTCGFVLIFKETFKQKNGIVKGNCDAELVLQAMIDFPNYDQAVIVSGDGDFSCLVKYLIKKSKLQTVIVPNSVNSSWLLRKVAKGNFIVLDQLESKLAYKKI